MGKTKTVVSKIIGGLGNQLFQFAYGLHLSRREGAELACDLDGFAGYDLRTYSLGSFHLPVVPADAKVLRPIRWLGGNRFSMAFAKRALNLTGGRYLYVREGDNVDRFSPRAKWIYLDGYWQRHDFLVPLREELLRWMQPRVPVASLDLESGQNTVAIHVRRGDYVTLSWTLSVDYYLKAFSVMKSKLGENLTPIIFSDDPEWVKANLKLSERQIVRGKMPTLTDFIHIRQCRHQIIGNSTFSWWAAWLNENPDKVVIAPRTWPGSHGLDLGRLIPSDWEII